MHIVLGALSAIAGVIWALVALQRSGFNPASLNPFLWYQDTGSGFLLQVRLAGLFAPVRRSCGIVSGFWGLRRFVRALQCAPTVVVSGF